MAKSSTLYRFQLELADIDHNFYESLDLRVACHPSEDHERLVVRVLARTVAHEQGLDFGRGLSTPEDPALWTRSALGDIESWIDVGCPSADRLHRASKASRRVLVFTHKPEHVLRKEWSSRIIHRADEIDVIQFSAELVRNLARELQRNTQWYITLQEGTISVVDGDSSFDAALKRGTLADFVA
jgi:uncharacterized protein YaeQ